MARLNLSVEDDVPEKLATLAGSKRKQGQFLSSLIRAMHNGEAYALEGMDVESLRLQLMGLSGQVKALEGRILKLEQTMAVFIADTAISTAR